MLPSPVRISTTGSSFLGAGNSQRERPPSPNRAWQKPTGAQFESLPKTKNVFTKPTAFSPRVEKPPNGLIGRGLINKKKKTILKINNEF